MSATKWLCPFNSLVACDDTCIMYGRNSGCGLANDISNTSRSIKRISEYMDEATGTIHRIGEAFESIGNAFETFGELADESSPYDSGEQVKDGLEGVAESIGDLSRVLYATFGSVEIGNALDGLASIADAMPDTSVIAESIDVLAKMTNPTEYKQHVNEVVEMTLREARAYSRAEGDDD